MQITVEKEFFSEGVNVQFLDCGCLVLLRNITRAEITYLSDGQAHLSLETESNVLARVATNEVQGKKIQARLSEFDIEMRGFDIDPSEIELAVAV